MLAVEHGVDEDFSPDGRYLVYGVRSPFQPDMNFFVRDLTSRGAAPAKVMTVLDVDFPVWSPDANKMAFIQRNDDGSKQLTVLDVERLTLSKIANDGDSPRWFPDSKRLLYLAP